MNTTERPEQAAVVTGSDTPTQQLCPYVTRPFPDCHCVEITSLTIPFVLTYCNGNQLTCEIYRRNSTDDEG